MFNDLGCTSAVTRTTLGERILMTHECCRHCRDLFRVNLNMRFNVIDPDSDTDAENYDDAGDYDQFNDSEA